MGKIAERLSDIAKRCGDLSPLREPIRRALWEANRNRALEGVTVGGQKFAPLAKSTLKRRKGNGPPCAPHYSQSRIVTAYEVNVQAGPQRLSFTGSWPGFKPAEYFATGTRNMPRRDPMGFSAKTLDGVRKLMGAYVLSSPQRSWRDRISSFFGR